ncbi:uncharacterized protein CTHT_0058160 [Thermochaetoides thermophila DSM 1495]|uniref:BTB domain-containing protein n=1 Tax=Chaetomium thermophilum (strain DSM 1495 / CBS 144.50 / IMI 039719) TaxID=759272 RepID=G0SCR5_CHATD|nr:hypothetical protein CTHT_0058160 [Thermochaetoides thermophila DSM 1495]EGS19191.1 hypothetical protein CTHT_0058160 [Thermochaetoides thermophila DSM 1495]
MALQPSTSAAAANSSNSNNSNVNNNNTTTDNQNTTTATASLFGGHSQTTPAAAGATSQTANVSFSSTLAPSSNSAFIMPNTPVKTRMHSDGYRPKVTRTLGQRPACLVNASVTYCGNNQIYAFGGFDQYTDEVYNHVLRLDLVSHQWTLVDNYGDIPGVRMGHTATLYQGDKLLVFGGENEHRTYLSDLIIFDIKTAHWTQPQVSGPIPKGRARHAAVLHDDKLFIMGGITGHDNYVLDDICYLDLKTFTWSRSWRFVGRFDHSAYIWNDRVWVFGGLSEEMDKVSDLWWLDLKGNPAFQSPPTTGTIDRTGLVRTVASPRPPYQSGSVVGSSGYAANSRSQQVNPSSFHLRSYAPPAPGHISALKFVHGPNVPSQMQGIHFHVYTSGTLLDFVTPAATISSKDCSLSALDLTTFRWQKLAEGREIFKSGYRWHYCTLNEDGTKAWLLGCPTEPAAADGINNLEEFLSDIMEVDLRRYGFLGNAMSSEQRTDPARPALRSRNADVASKGLGADLARLFNKPPESGSGTDFIVTALPPNYDEDEIMGSALVHSGEDGSENWLASDAPTSPPIHVHRLILQARWPHFARLWSSQMAEYHTKKMHIPEPYTVVKAFLYYLYTDRIDPVDDDHENTATDLSDVAGLLVMSNMYNIPHLRLLCVNRLSRELDVEHACIIWYCAGLANEDWLRRRAANFCMTHWGRVVRTVGFQRLPRQALVELSQEVDTEGRVVGGDELDMMVVLSGEGGIIGRYAADGSLVVARRKESVSSNHTQMLESEVDDDDGMEMS